jgi:hypothetical protein
MERPITIYNPRAIEMQRRQARWLKTSQERFMRREEGKLDRLAAAQAKRDRKNAKRARDAAVAR